MPKVGKMKFPYTKRGMEEAQNYARQVGKPMNVEGYRHGGRVPSRGVNRPIGNARGMNPNRAALENLLRLGYKKGGKVKNGKR